MKGVQSLSSIFTMKDMDVQIYIERRCIYERDRECKNCKVERKPNAEGTGHNSLVVFSRKWKS